MPKLARSHSILQDKRKRVEAFKDLDMSTQSQEIVGRLLSKPVAKAIETLVIGKSAVPKPISLIADLGSNIADPTKSGRGPKDDGTPGH